MASFTKKLANSFKILDAFEKKDAAFFKGREREAKEIHELLSSGNQALVFGESGVGKTSLVKCGLANLFDDDDWLDLLVLRGENINRSLHKCLRAQLSQSSIDVLHDRTLRADQLIQEVYLDHFKPIYLIFDQ